MKFLPKNYKAHLATWPNMNQTKTIEPIISKHKQMINK